MCQRVQNAALVLVALVVWLSPASAQVMVGDSVNLRAGGDLSFGYSGTSGNADTSSHSLDMGGHGWMHGFYYKPQFVSFDFQPYYRRSQSDSIFQSITNGSGFTADTSIFSGSHFPGTISYSRTYDNTGQFGVPGISGIASHGNGNNFSVGWSALLPHKPTLTAVYSTTSGESSVFGANTNSNASSRNFTLQSTYNLAGFELMGQYVRLTTDSTFPSIIEGGETQESHAGSNAFTVNAGHALPMTGHWNLVWNRSSYSSEFRSGSVAASNNGRVNDLTTLFSLNPTHKLGLAFGANYNDNAFGALQERILASGGVPLTNLSSSLRTVSVNSQASYSVFSHLALYARANHYERWLPGDRRGLTQFSGNASFNFMRSFLGALTFSAGVIDTFTQEGNSGASLVGNVNYLRRYHAWEFGADFGYTQQVQTLFDVYTTSTYRYAAQAKRRFRGFQWMSSFHASHSGFTHLEGFRSRSEGLSTNLVFRRFTVGGQYSQSAGTSILTSIGLVELPPGVPPTLLQQPILYDAKSYGGGASFQPFRRFTVSAHYNKAHSATAGPAIDSGFQSTIFNARLMYRLRKLNVEGNFTKFRQSINTGALPAEINSYYIRFARWFNIF
ncbi:MAG: hypothetical protein HY508_11085 [Acidobacteria bacterium]|nr:hypothetical protein [Acidobacteriota bacterium]